MGVYRVKMNVIQSNAFMFKRHNNKSDLLHGEPIVYTCNQEFELARLQALEVVAWRGFSRCKHRSGDDRCLKIVGRNMVLVGHRGVIFCSQAGHFNFSCATSSVFCLGWGGKECFAVCTSHEIVIIWNIMNFSTLVRTCDFIVCDCLNMYMLVIHT